MAWGISCAWPGAKRNATARPEPSAITQAFVPKPAARPAKRLSRHKAPAAREAIEAAEAKLLFALQPRLQPDQTGLLGADDRGFARLHIIGVASRYAHVPDRALVVAADGSQLRMADAIYWAGH